MGSVLEREAPFYYDHEGERAYGMVTRDMITNEIFRRVEPKGRTFGEYLWEEFPGVDVHGSIHSDDVYNRINTIRV